MFMLPFANPDITMVPARSHQPPCCCASCITHFLHPCPWAIVCHGHLWESRSHTDLAQYKVTAGLLLFPPGNLLASNFPTAFSLEVNSNPPYWLQVCNVAGRVPFHHSYCFFLRVGIFRDCKTPGLSPAFHLICVPAYLSGLLSNCDFLFLIDSYFFSI